MSTTKTIRVEYLARVEGEGALDIRYQGSAVQEVKLRIFEPPRFFESFLQGRDFREAPDITARICGICPIAYQMSSVHAMEAALNWKISPEVRLLRRLAYCGEWIESHVLHIYMLHAPDFLGHHDAISLSKIAPEEVQRGLRLKKAGNEIVRVLGGREIHPINIRVGGFYKIPEAAKWKKLREELLWGRESAENTVRWVSQFTFPDFTQDYEFVALHHPDEYALNEGRLISNKGLDIAVKEYEQHFAEIHVPHSNALQAIHKGAGTYLVGPLARYNLNFAQLSDHAKQLARHFHYDRPILNPFASIIARSIEVVYAFDEALRIVDQMLAMTEDTIPFHEGSIQEGSGAAATEAPRGLLYHHYRLDEQGRIQSAKIVPPTSQNQSRIEEDLKQFVAEKHQLSDEELRWQCEQAIRNYDPCISCATHFLRLNVERQ